MNSIKIHAYALIKTARSLPSLFFPFLTAVRSLLITLHLRAVVAREFRSMRFRAVSTCFY